MVLTSLFSSFCEIIVHECHQPTTSTRVYSTALLLPVAHFGVAVSVFKCVWFLVAMVVCEGQSAAAPSVLTVHRLLRHDAAYVCAVKIPLRYSPLEGRE